MRGFLKFSLRQGDPREKFLISIHAGDRGRDDAAPFAGVLGGDEMADFLDGLLMECRIANDATSGNILPPQLELRLDEANDRAAGLDHAEDGGEDFGEGNEGQVHHGEPDFFTDVSRDHVAGVELFFHDDSGVVAEFPNKLIGPYVDGVDPDGAALEQAIGETAG